MPSQRFKVRRTHVLTSDAVALLLWGKHPGDFVTISEIKKIDDVVWLKLHESSEEQLKKSSNYSEFDIKVEGWVRSNDPEKGEIYLEQVSLSLSLCLNVYCSIIGGVLFNVEWCIR